MMPSAYADDDIQPDLLLDQLQIAVLNPTAENIQDLKELFMRVDKLIQESEIIAEEFYEDFHVQVAPIINGVEFRVDIVSDEATSDKQILELVFNHIAKGDENVEVILATNPHITDDLKWQLAESEFEWEEDGTREALARNQNDPKLLSYLASVGNSNVRHQVALNHSTPAEVLDQLADETAQCNFQMEEYLFGELTRYRGFTRWCVAQNPSTDSATLKRILSNELESLGSEVDDEIFKVAKKRLNV